MFVFVDAAAGGIHKDKKNTDMVFPEEDHFHILVRQAAGALLGVGDEDERAPAVRKDGAEAHAFEIGEVQGAGGEGAQEGLAEETGGVADRIHDINIRVRKGSLKLLPEAS